MAENFDWEKVCVSKFCTVCADFVNYEKAGQETGINYWNTHDRGFLFEIWFLHVLDLFFRKGMKVCQALLQRSPCCEDFLKKSDGGLLRGTGYESSNTLSKLWVRKRSLPVLSWLIGKLWI